MIWASALSRNQDPESAAREVATALRSTLGEGPVDLALAFFGGAMVAGAEVMAATLKQALAPGCLAGVSGGAVIGAEREIEDGQALSVLAARLPGVDVKPFILVGSAWGEAIQDPLEFARHTPGVSGGEIVLLFADPFTLDVESVLGAFNRHAKGVRVVGGIASAGQRPQSNVLLLNDWIAHEGGVGIALRGALRVDVVVSQGCRPIGPPLEVTRAESNLILELDGQPALERT